MYRTQLGCSEHRAIRVIIRMNINIRAIRVKTYKTAKMVRSIGLLGFIRAIRVYQGY